MRAFAFQADFDQGIRIVDGGIRICYDAVLSDVFFHVAFPALIIRLLKYFDFLAPTENHLLSLLLLL